MSYVIKRKKLKAAPLFFFVLLLSAALPVKAGDKAVPGRIISLAPNITEILFDLGLGSRVVGVTRYCDFPEEAAALSRVGGFMDPGYEAIVALRPDLVILLMSHRDAIGELAGLGLSCLAVPHETIADIHQSITLIGRACRAEKAAAALLKKITDDEKDLRASLRGIKRSRVMICVGRDRDSGAMAGLYIAGKNNFYDEIIEGAGGVNACTETTIAYPQMSAEGVIRINPEVIIDLAGPISPKSGGFRDIIGQWDRLGPVEAVRQGRVHLVTGTHAMRPGPRYILFMKELARRPHPEAFTGRARHE